MYNSASRLLANIEGRPLQSAHTSHDDSNVVYCACVVFTKAEWGNGASKRMENRQNDWSSRLFCVWIMVALHHINILYVFYEAL